MFAPGAQGVRVDSDVPVDVMTSPDEQVHVSVDGSYTVEQPSVRVTPSDGLLEVRASCHDAQCKVDVVIEVPASVAVQAKASGTSLNVVGVSGPVSAEASDGSISLMNLRSKQVSATSHRGSVNIALDTPPDNLAATTTAGSITVQVAPSVTYAIDALSAQGSTNLNVSNDPASTHHLHLRTTQGSITVN
jgi:DUF4097 and DUF4098 domain-containing protein YvlB